MISWLNGRDIQGASESFQGTFDIAFNAHCANNWRNTFNKTWNGRSLLSAKELYEFCSNTFKPSYTSSGIDHSYVEMYGEHGYMTIGFYGETNVRVVTTDRELVSTLHEVLKKKILTESDPGRVFMLTQGFGGGLNFETIGVGGKNIERANYTEEVMSGFDHFISELETRDPCGRLVLLVGPTGTGKTTLIRGMLNTDKANFAFLPPQLVPEIGGPQIIKAIKDFNNTYKNRPLVLVLEDADECLLPRGGDNMSSITSILNASEGILGQLLDVRLVATTNANIKEVDSALSRPGRMCCRMDVNKLTAFHANEVMRRLVPGDDELPLFTDWTSLAEIYSKAKKLAGKSGHTEKKTSKIGF